MRWIDIGDTFTRQVCSNIVLECYEKALQVCCNHFPTINRQIARIHELIGIHYIMNKYDSAALYHFQE